MNSPYSIIPTGLLALFFYLSTYLLVRTGMLRITVHRQIWNILLLITFFVTAGLGLILAIQVNYKIKLPITDKLLVWHVDFGIGMAMIAIFHFLWHMNYYLKLFQFKEKTLGEKRNNSYESWNTSEIKAKITQVDHLPVFALGMTSLITQVVLLREFLAIFEGNELVIGSILASWMILTGLGAYFGKSATKINFSPRFVFYALIFSGIIPIFTVFFLNYLKNIVFPIGTMVGFFQILSTSLILLLPFCFMSGFLFTYYAYNLSRKYQANLVSKVYAIEAAGSLGGGLVYSFILIYFFHSLQILSVVTVVNFIFALIYSKNQGMKPIKIIMTLILIIILLATFVFNTDLRIKKFLFPNQQIIFMKDTPYGNLAITESADQKNFFENNVLLFSTDNIIVTEETAHFAMLQHDSPDKILLIGGGITGLTDEILKYPVDRIDYLEINPWIIRIGKKFTKTLDDKRIRIINDDARHFLRKTEEKYDVIIVDMPSPSSAQINRYFTIEFFRELKGRTTAEAVISLSLPSTENYVSEKASQVQSVIFHSLKSVFKNVIIIPGEKNYFIASDKIVDLNVAQLSVIKGVNNVYVNPFYIDDDNLHRRSDYILQNISETIHINKDFQPVAYFMEIGYWISHFRTSYWIFGIIGIVFILFILFRLNTINIGLFTTGFTSSSMEVLFIFTFQIIYGYVYHMVGVIITIFMAGLAIGAVYQRNTIRTKNINIYWKIQMTIAVFSAILPGIFYLLKIIYVPSVLVYMIFSLITLVISILTGYQFSLASRIEQKNIASVSGGLYSIDLLGSALGAFLVSVFLFPILGIVKVFVFLALINLISGFLSYRYCRTT